VTAEPRGQDLFEPRGSRLPASVAAQVVLRLAIAIGLGVITGLAGPTRRLWIGGWRFVYTLLSGRSLKAAGDYLIENRWEALAALVLLSAIAALVMTHRWIGFLHIKREIARHESAEEPRPSSAMAAPRASDRSTERGRPEPA